VTSVNDFPLGSPPPFSTIKVITRIPGRSPEWKAHVSMARAKAAVIQGGGGHFHDPELWEVSPAGDWVRVPLPEKRSK
jgi:hypothetical protein